MVRASVVRLFLLFVLAVFARGSFAGLEIIDTEGLTYSKNVVGVWSMNTKIRAESDGGYYMKLSNLADSNLDFASKFKYLGVVVSSASEQLASIVLKGEKDVRLTEFTLESGEYWVSIFAITNRKTNIGEFKLELAEVPLPASFWFMFTSILGLVSFVRQKNASNKSVSK